MFDNKFMVEALRANLLFILIVDNGINKLLISSGEFPKIINCDRIEFNTQCNYKYLLKKHTHIVYLFSRNKNFILMAKLSLVFIFVLLMVASVEVTRSKAQAIKRCETTLSNSGCDLATCRKQCFLRYRIQNGLGQCIEGKPHIYGCVCFYDCAR